MAQTPSRDPNAPSPLSQLAEKVNPLGTSSRRLFGVAEAKNLTPVSLNNHVSTISRLPFTTDSVNALAIDLAAVQEILDKGHETSRPQTGYEREPSLDHRGKKKSDGKQMHNL